MGIKENKNSKRILRKNTMLKRIFFFMIVFAALVNGQSYKIIKDTNSGKSMLIGIATRKIFNDSSFSNWFTREYRNYKADTNTIKNIKSKLSGKTIKIVLGTWCSDSRREVPRMLKILDIVEFPQDSLSLVFVDRTKNGIADETKGLNIERVPTFIVYEKNKEIGRIIETPEETLEKDLLKIIKK